MKAIYVIGIIALLSVMMITPASATTVNIVTDADTHVKSYVPDSNFGDSPELPVEWYDDSGYGVKRALTHFNLSSIPVDATIDAATLHLYVGSRFDYGTPTYNIHRIEESWGEMTPTWNNQPGYTPTPIDSIIQPTCADCWDVYDVTSDVQDFVEGTSINYGWLIKLEMEDDPEWPGTYYRSREHGSDTSPYLEVTYTESAPLEFGDAPDPTYPSNLSSDGARHSETDTECLGLNITGTDWKDFELDANVPDADLLDDGLPALALTTNNPAQTVDFEVTNKIAQNDLIVNILLDLNQNGVWDSGEHVVQNQPINIVGPADGVFTSTAFSTVGATEGATWMRVTLTRQSINTDWDGTMASAGYAEPFGCGETEDWEVEMVNVPSVETATGSGTAYFDSDAGTIVDLTAIAELALPGEGKPVGMSFPHGFFSFNITDLTLGQTVEVTVTLPDAVPVGTQYWKYGPTLSDPADHWYQIPIGDDDGDNVITITLVDGGLGDDNLTPDGMIVDPGGSGTPPPAPEVPAMTPIGFVMVMFSLFGLVVFTTRKVNKR